MARISPGLSAIVVNLNRVDLLEPCLESLEAAARAGGLDLECVVVDNASRDGSVEMVHRRFPAARVITLSENRGFAGGVVAGLGETSADWVLLLNNDATVAPGALSSLMAATADPDVGAIAAQMRFAGRPDVINSAGIGVDVLGVAYDRHLGDHVDEDARRSGEVFGASGGAALLRRRALDECGGFDAGYFAYLEDVDVAWRLRMSGWRAIYCPDAIIFHHHSATSRHGSAEKYFLVGRNRVRLLARNMTTGHLLRFAVPIALFDLAYVLFVLVADRSLAPLRGRVSGLREWRSYRRQGASLRRPVRLAPRRGVAAAMRRRMAWLRFATPAARADAQ